ncbi:glycoside hydrolase N-terminal domain-containing protein [Pedobacter sp. SYSU D00535]|uniref:glycoside hydrolase family 95 protein n=1 Tax=Pedobacter sp. SYSU D00535 TaxID=2810308 RepID=UPI001A9701F1|nr:glycoside hydrolase family 95 protein [Pedobacter sp. SYSU D00535]
MKVLQLKSALFLFLLVLVAEVYAQLPPDALTLWYDRPASNWNEALPIGNGKLAAMVFGGTSMDRLQLNEETIWAGEPGNNVPRNASEPINQIRRLLFDGKYQEAQALANQAFPRQAPAELNYGMPYQTAGNLLLSFDGHDEVSNYRRDLDINKAIASVTYTTKGVTYKREYIAAIPDQVLVVRLTADKASSISFNLGVNTPYKKYSVETQGGKLLLSGNTTSLDNKVGKVRYQVQVLPRAEGGRVVASDSSIRISNANAVTLYISIATNYINYKDLSGNEAKRAAGNLAAAVKKNYNAIRTGHIAAYKRYFDRVQLDLGSTDAIRKPTDQRIAAFAKSDDPALTALYFQFGRYLLISSSLPGSQPANLQGKWNDKLSPPWDSKYTININTEMNYWPAEVTALPEMHQPLFEMIRELSITGKESASKMYQARGWNVHHNTDLWRITGPVDGGFYGLWPMGGAWLSQHLWQHYLYTGDKAFLKKNYPLLKGAAMFYADVLQEEPSNKWLVVAPSMSPENSYMKSVSVSAGTTMDNQLVFDVFANAIRSAELLGVDEAFADTLKQLTKRLPPMQIGKFGQLQEWLQDWDREDDKHRHVSHLYGLFPGNQISPFRQPELFQAAKASLIARGDKSTGWSMGWKVNLWARLQDGNRAYKLIEDQLSPAPLETSGQNGGTYPNLLDAHPPFQIDGNFGCTSGIAEMLLQSHDGEIHLLPALPDKWQKGSIKGLVARGGFVVDMDWDKGRITRLNVHSKLGGNCRIRVHSPLTPTSKNALKPAVGPNPNPFYELADVKAPLVSKAAEMKKAQVDEGKLFDFSTSAGSSYQFVQQ